MLCTSIVLNVKTKTCCELVFFGEFNEQSLVILWVNWIKNKSFWKRFACIPITNVKDRKNDNWSLFYLLLIKHNLCIVIKNKGTMSEMSLTFTYLSGSKQSEVQTKGVNELNWRTMYSIFLGEKNNWEMGRVKRDFCLSTARCFCFLLNILASWIVDTRNYVVWDIFTSTTAESILF